MTPRRNETVDVLIVGAGPAGLAAAARLREFGVARVVVVEREPEAGGIPRHCGHSPFGMREFRRVLSGPAYARRLAKTAAGLGADIRLLHSVMDIDRNGVATVATPQGVIAIAAFRIILATGARESTRAGRLFGGDRAAGIMNTAALQSYVHLYGKRPFRKPVIVGSELVSMSAIATCLTAGIRPAALVESRRFPLARYPFALFPRLAMVPVHYGSIVESINGAGRVSSVSIRSLDGASRDITCDGVVVSGRFLPDAALAALVGIEIDPGSGGPSVDQHGRSTHPHIFVAGNLLRAVETAGWCWSEGRRVAAQVARDLAHPAGTSAPVLQTIRHSPMLKYVVPQRVALDGGDGQGIHFQMRVNDVFQGVLEIGQGGRLLAAKGIASAPERRIGLGLALDRLDAGAGEITFTSRARARDGTPVDGQELRS